MPETLVSTFGDLRSATLTALSFPLTAQCLNTE